MKKFTLSLHSHPTTPTSWINNITVDATVNTEDTMLIYNVIGDIQRLQLPTFCNTPNRADNLWQQTCGEAFVAPINATHYREWNFSSTGHWQLYEFTNYRSARTTPNVPAPRIHYLVTPEQFTLTAQIPHTWYPSDTQLRMGITMILQDITGKIYYWALTHPLDAPDFHWDGGWTCLY